MKSYQMRLAKPLKPVKMLAMKVIFTITLRTILAGFTETLANFKKWHD